MMFQIAHTHMSHMHCVYMGTRMNVLSTGTGQYMYRTRTVRLTVAILYTVRRTEYSTL